LKCTPRNTNLKGSQNFICKIRRCSGGASIIIIITWIEFQHVTLFVWCQVMEVTLRMVQVYFFWNPYERERDIFLITPSWWSHQRPTPKHLPRCLHLWAAAAMVARHLRGEHDSDSSPSTCTYIYKIACDAVSAGSHFQRSFPGTVAKVVTAILRLKTHVLSKPRIQIDPFTNFY